MATSTSVILRTEGLSKRYGPIVALDGLDLEVGAGEIFGYIGPNGSGKTTTIRLLLALLRPTSGRAFIFGHDCQSEQMTIKEDVGVLPEGVQLYERLTGEEFLDYLGGFQHRRLPLLRRELCQRLGLSQADLRRRVRGYSRGMKQKLGIIQALQHDPPLVILDEPTEGLDPLIQQQFFTILEEFRERGATVFMSSHVLADVEKVCDRVGIIRSGRLVALQTVAELRRRPSRRVELVFAGEPAPGIEGLPGALSVKREGRTVRLEFQGEPQELLRWLAAYNLEDVVIERPHLDDIFLQYYQGGTES